MIFISKPKGQDRMEDTMNDNDFFPSALPEEVGVSSKSLKDFLVKLEDMELPLHSAILMRSGKVVMETYYKPYDRNTLHRMFSITKSFVSLAIGLLEQEGKLSLDDRIIDFFPDKLPDEGVHPYTAAMTIRDMLRMASAHDKTTFKVMKEDDWTKTFFHVTPSHIPGTCFSYDTSSTHTLGALVERLSDMELLDYLRSRFLDDLDFSKDAYCCKDPSGVSMGGSGMMATPYDMLKVMKVISDGGFYNGKQLLPSEYLKEATKKQIETYAKHVTFEEMQGYGYQFWRTTHNGIVCYGMGGQLVLWLPDKDLILVTTADAQGRQGGVQLIYDTFWNTVYPSLSDIPATATVSDIEIANSQKSLSDYSATRELISLSGSLNDNMTDRINGKTFILDKNPKGFSSFCLSFDKTKNSGSFIYSNKSGEHKLDFGIGFNQIQTFPDYDYKTAVSASWKLPDTLIIKAQLIDECIGHVYFQFSFKDDSVTLMMRKVEETMFGEFDGFISGKM